MQTIILIILLGFLSGALGAAIARRYGGRFGLLDIPNERSSHTIPTVRGGGMGIWIAFIVVGIFVVKDLPFTLIICSIGVLGLIEDIFTIPSVLRLAVQLAASASVVFLLMGGTNYAQGAAIYIFWIIFIAGTSNFYNFMDGINGIAGLTGVVGFGLMALFSLSMTDDTSVAFSSLALVAACLGFLPFNLSKGRVFMGDVGSVFLGFAFASFLARLSETFGVFLCLVMFLSTFYADAVLTIFYRLKSGENLLKAHRSHLYQYMSNELNIPHWKVSFAYASTQFVFGVLALVAYREGLVWQFLVFAVFGVMSLAAYKVIKGIKPGLKFT